jgi:type VI secretion system ImpA family protein
MTEHYFSEALGMDFPALLAPIPGSSAAGVSIAGSAIYSAIRRAREEDDDTLPMGAWEHELKRADWNAVSRLCAKALISQSKDLQLAAWLLEAEMQRHGFHAMAPCLDLITALHETYRQDIFPADDEHRQNIFLWLTTKSSAVLRRVPLSSTGSGVEYAWSDWEQAQRNEQIRNTLGNDAQVDGATVNIFSAALASTPSTDIVARQELLSAAHASLGRLEDSLGDAAPNFTVLRDQIENIALMLAAEARRRGIVIEAARPEEETGAPEGAYEHGRDTPEMASPDGDRDKLYRSLARMADQLARIEPHSPVPYLIRRAVSWGRLDTAQLYSEVFVRCGGQINIFELLGLEEQISAHQESSPS